MTDSPFLPKSHPITAGLMALSDVIEQEANQRTKIRAAKAVLAMGALPDDVQGHVINVAVEVLEEMRGEIQRMFHIRRLLEQEQEEDG
jgi:hypothetical protein